MITYFKMKHQEWKIKGLFYSAVLRILDSREEIRETLLKMYTALKDMPADEFQKEFIGRLAEIIHESRGE